jgi:phosphoribosylformimino-5-aminoimidazole carboxamide ribonucleotide (ProFAR) isomerase
VFTLLPAIDVSRGSLAVWTRDGPRALTVHGGDPLAAAAAFVGAGARWLHVVDLDLAMGGTPAAEGVVRSIVQAHPTVAVQASGGIATATEAERFVGAGAARVVLGSAGLTDEAATLEVLASLGDRCVVGLEVDGDRIAPRGRRQTAAPLDLMATVGWLSAVGARAFLVTSVGRVGSREGADVELIRRVVRAGRPTLAAGGIDGIADLRRIRDAGAVGAVVGTAALEGSLDLAEAVAWAEA